MCGIAGIHSGTAQIPEAELLLAMGGELHHRGPDGVGLYLDEGVGLVNTRLSIIDLAGGDQPIGTEDGRFWVVQNGEIYNHQAIRRELEALGHRFRTGSDTEVIVHAYQEWLEDCLHRFIGPFAFAVWDRRERQLFLARDRFGVRPLFLAEPEGQLIFGSEAKALLRHPGMRRELDPGAVIDTFTMWAPLPDRTAFPGIRELPPGCWLKVDADGRREERMWWDLAFLPLEQQRTGSEEELAEELAELLKDATRMRLLAADVPVGAYLSGGLDSSAIAALVNQVSGDTLRCFGIGFSDPHFDESAHQDQVAAALGVELQRVTVTPADVANLFPEVVRLAEKPLLRTAPAPMLALSGLARNAGYKVVLTGEGADELFAGYDLFRESQIRRFWARDAASTLRPRLFERLYPWLTRSATSAPAFARQFFGAGLMEIGDPLYSHRIRFTNTARLMRFLDPGVTTDAASSLDRLLARLPGGFDGFSGLAKAQYLEIITFLHGYLLHSQGDRMLMGNSVEGRFPFLDHRVAEFAASLPDGLRLRGLKDKNLLRRSVRGLLPAEVSQRPKRPYRAPIAPSFVGKGAPDYVAELLDPARLVQTGLFAPKMVQLLLDKCRRSEGGGVGEMDDMALVGVISIQLLHEQFVRAPQLAPSRSPNRIVVGDRVELPAGVA
jgi:asparagine synthase (glutamine-hydrolysing)